MQFIFSARKQTTLLGMLDCEYLQLLSINVKMASNPNKRRKLNKQQSKVSPTQTITLKIICVLMTTLIRK